MSDVCREFARNDTNHVRYYWTILEIIERLNGGSGCVRLRCRIGKTGILSGGDATDGQIFFAERMQWTRERSRWCLSRLKHVSGSLSQLCGRGRRISIFSQDDFASAVCGFFEHRRRVQFNGLRCRTAPDHHGHGPNYKDDCCKNKKKEESEVEKCEIEIMKECQNERM